MWDSQSEIEELTPPQTLAALADTPASALVDVRTKAEWAFTGLADISATGRPLWTIEWVSFPRMTLNPDFAGQLLEAAGGRLPECLHFICRSGARSKAAAIAVAALAEELGQKVHCINVAEGFEGDLDAERHRGGRNGWKAHGLPWRQS